MSYLVGNSENKSVRDEEVLLNYWVLSVKTLREGEIKYLFNDSSCRVEKYV